MGTECPGFKADPCTCAKMHLATAGEINRHIGAGKAARKEDKAAGAADGQ